jgi:hypothetical protein
VRFGTEPRSSCIVLATIPRSRHPPSAIASHVGPNRNHRDPTRFRGIVTHRPRSRPTWDRTAIIVLATIPRNRDPPSTILSPWNRAAIIETLHDRDRTRGRGHRARSSGPGMTPRNRPPTLLPKIQDPQRAHPRRALGCEWTRTAPTMLTKRGQSSGRPRGLPGPEQSCRGSFWSFEVARLTQRYDPPDGRQILLDGLGIDPELAALHRVEGLPLDLGLTRFRGYRIRTHYLVA